MATSTTTNLNLVKETNTEPIVNHRGHFNDNMDLIDAAYNTLASRSRGQQTWGNLKQNTTWGELIGTNVVAAATTTDNLELIQPGYDSTVDVESFNDNMSILDSTIGAIDVTNDGSIADQLSAVQDSLDQGLKILFQNIETTKSYTVPVGGASIEVNFSIPDGYTMIDAEISSFGGVSQLFERAKHYSVGGNIAYFFVGTQATNSVSGTLTAQAKCIKITG